MANNLAEMGASASVAVANSADADGAGAGAGDVAAAPDSTTLMQGENNRTAPSDIANGHDKQHRGGKSAEEAPEATKEVVDLTQPQPLWHQPAQLGDGSDVAMIKESALFASRESTGVVLEEPMKEVSKLQIDKEDDGGMNTQIMVNNGSGMSNKSDDVTEVELVEPRQKQNKVASPSHQAAIDVEGVQPVENSQKVKTPSPKLQSSNEKDNLAPSSKPSPAPKTPQELYDQIKNSRDKLFFIAYSHNNDPVIAAAAGNNNANNKRGKKKKIEYQWYLVRVDLSTCQDLENTKNCHETGRYYVEFYTKASYDQGVVLPGNRLENGIPAAKMKAKPDSESRYWLEWHDYHFDKSGDMIVGKPKEFLPNSKEAILRRLMDLSQRRRSSGQSSLSGGNGEEGQERLMSEYHPNFNKYTPWADEINLMDAETRLVGPFDFEDVKPPPLDENDLATLSEDMKRLFASNHSKLHVKDRVHLGRWKELLGSIKGRDIDPPTMPVESKRKNRRLSGGKRAREEANGKESQVSSGKKVRDMSKAQAIQSFCAKRGGSELAVTAQKEPLLLFAATSSHPALSVHASCGETNSDKAVVSKDKMKEGAVSVFDEAFNQMREATSKDGRTYYLKDELKEALKQSLESWVSRIESHVFPPSIDGAQASSITARSTEPLEGLPETNFAQEEVESFPVAFGVLKEDTGGDKNAKIATLDYETEQRRMKRSANTGVKGTKRSKSLDSNTRVRGAKRSKSLDSSAASKSKSTPRKRSRKASATVNEKDLRVPTEPAEGFPAGWVIRKVPRGTTGGSKSHDTYYYSPKKQFKFRSKPEANRFLEAVKSSGGDEMAASEKMRK